jgi:hypothetical protein
MSFMAMLPMMGPLLAALGGPTSMAELQQKLGSKDASRCAVFSYVSLSKIKSCMFICVISSVAKKTKPFLLMACCGSIRL